MEEATKSWNRIEVIQRLLGIEQEWIQILVFIHFIHVPENYFYFETLPSSIHNT